MIRLVVVGFGYWGPNLVRNFAACPGVEVVGVCDADPKQQARVRQMFPHLRTWADFDAALACGSDAIAIATPASTHYALASRALEAGKHVLIEKPITQKSAEARALIALANKAGKTLMVDHTFVYSPAVRRMKDMIAAGEIGEVFYVDSVRINLGRVQRDLNVVWDLAPHDFSIIDYVLGAVPQRITAVGKAHINHQVDVAMVNLDYGETLLAGVHVNWLSPVKIRRMVFGGSRKSIVFNDLDPTEKLRIYDCGIEHMIDPQDRQRVLVDYRLGDLWSPHLPLDEPLQIMARHFAECIRSGATPITDGNAGLRVVELLESCDHSLAQAGRPVAHAGMAPRLPSPLPIPTAA